MESKSSLHAVLVNINGQVYLLKYIYFKPAVQEMFKSMFKSVLTIAFLTHTSCKLAGELIV